MWFRKLILAGSLALCSLPANAAEMGAAARPVHFAQNYLVPVRAGQSHLMLHDVEAILHRLYGGRLNNAQFQDGDHPYYVVRWEMPNGDFRDFTVDAVTGQVR